MIFTLTVKPNEPTKVNRQGRFIHIVAAASEIDLRFVGANMGIDDRTKALQGMAIELAAPIDELIIFSDVAQTVQVWLSDTKLTYGLSETIQAGSRGLNSYSQKIASGEAQILSPAAVGRGKVTIFPDDDIFVGGANLNAKNGIKVLAGEKFEFATQAEIRAFAANKQYQPVFVPQLAANDNFKSFDTLLGNVDIVVKGGRYWYVGSAKGIYRFDDNNHRTLVSDAVSSAYGLCMYVPTSDGGFIFAKSGTSEITLFNIETEVSYSKLPVGFAGESIVSLSVDKDKNVLLTRKAPDGTLQAFVGQFDTIDTQITEVTTPEMQAVTVDAANQSERLGDVWVIAAKDKVFSTVDAGVNWHVSPFVDFDHLATRVHIDPVTHDLFARQSDNAIYKSSDGGATWEEFFNRNSSLCSFFLKSYGDHVYILGNVFLHYSNDGGASWFEWDINEVATPQNSVSQFMSLNVLSEGVYIGYSSGSLYQFDDIPASQVGGFNVSLLAEET